MKLLLTLALLALSLPALAQPPTTIDITATMPATTGSTSCQLYLDGTAVAGGAKSCGVAIPYPALLPGPGVYEFTYRGVNAGGQTALSPVTTLDLALTVPPEDPTSPPTITFSCNPSPCPASFTITITSP